jgi:hypothetical protein
MIDADARMIEDAAGWRFPRKPCPAAALSKETLDGAPHSW